ncbi:MAG: DMT family transporter [Eubacteriales bacterium]|jgi:drug/metabolite transporter (DMT)-like permease
MTRSKKFLGALLAVLGGVCWGLSGSMGQYLFQNEGMDTTWLVPIRLGGAAAILLIFSLIRYGAKTVIAPLTHKKDLIRLLIYGIAGVSFCQFTYFLTIQLSSAAVGTILQDLSPVMILFVGCVQQKRRPMARESLATVLGLVGVFLITTHGDLSSLSIPASALVAGLLCAAGVTIYNVTPGPLMDEYPIAILQGWSFLMGSAIFTLRFRPWTYNYVPSAMGIFGIFFVILVGNVAAFPLYMSGVKLIGPEKGILYGFSEPITAAVIGVALLGNRFTLWDGIGFAAVFAMMGLISAKNQSSQLTEKNRPEISRSADRKLVPGAFGIPANERP